MENVKYCVHRYPLLFMRAEYLKFPVAWKMFNTKFSIKCSILQRFLVCANQIMKIILHFAIIKRGFEN